MVSPFPNLQLNWTGFASGELNRVCMWCLSFQIYNWTEQGLHGVRLFPSLQLNWTGFVSGVSLSEFTAELNRVCKWGIPSFDLNLDLGRASLALTSVWRFSVHRLSYFLSFYSEYLEHPAEESGRKSAKHSFNKNWKLEGLAQSSRLDGQSWMVKLKT